MFCCLSFFSLSYHYSFTSGHRREAFKYTMKAADQAISRGSFRFGLNLLTRAQSISRTIDEFEVVEKVLEQALQDIVRFKTKSPKIPSNPILKRQGTITDGGTDANLIEEFQKLRELVHNSIQPPITVNVHSSEGGHQQTLQLKPIIYHTPLFPVREVSERDFFGPMKMLSFLSSRSLTGADLLSAPSEDQFTPKTKTQKPKLRFQLSYTGGNMGKSLFSRLSTRNLVTTNLEDKIVEGVEEVEEIEEKSSSKSIKVTTTSSRLSNYVFNPIIKFPVAAGYYAMKFVNGLFCSSGQKERQARYNSVPVRRQEAISGEDV